MAAIDSKTKPKVLIAGDEAPNSIAEAAIAELADVHYVRRG
jgi:hypothetical protein